MALAIQTLKNDGIVKFFGWRIFLFPEVCDSDVLETRQIRGNNTFFFLKNTFIGG